MNPGLVYSSVFMPIPRRHRISARHHVPHHELKELPKGVKLLAIARTVRWIGWGFGESLIPIFLFAFAASYAEAGLFSSIYEISLLLSLPVIGMLADRLSAKTLVITGLFLYPFIGLSYFFAGVSGLAFFIVLARTVNGVAWGLDSTGTDTYYRRVTDRNRLASSFGYIEMWGYGGWMLAALIGMLAAPYVPVHFLLLMVTPFTLLALPFVFLAPSDTHARVKRVGVVDSYKNTIREWVTWDVHLKLLAMLVLLTGVIETLIWIFIPIDAFIEGADLRMVILLAVVATVPKLFSYLMGDFADRHDKYRLVTYTLILVALVLSSLSFFPTYVVKLIASFLLGVLLEVFYLVGKSLVTILGPSETYGTRGSAFESVATLGGLVAPLLIGVSFDVLGFGPMALVLAGVCVLLALTFGALPQKRNHSDV